jgi:hypothetical protein
MLLNLWAIYFKASHKDQTHMPEQIHLGMKPREVK